MDAPTNHQAAPDSRNESQGAVVYISVDIASGTLIASRRISIEGPITSCLLFSSSRHLDAAQIAPPDLAVSPATLPAPSAISAPCVAPSVLTKVEISLTQRS